MSFPTTEAINSWFQGAHTTAVAAGGSVYVMEKRAEHEVVSSVLRWVYLTMLDELEDLNYRTGSRVHSRVAEMLYELHTTHSVDDTKDDELVDDYNDEASLLPDEDEDEDTYGVEIPLEDERISMDQNEPLYNKYKRAEVDPTLALEVINVLIKALIDKK